MSARFFYMLHNQAYTKQQAITANTEAIRELTAISGPGMCAIPNTFQCMHKNNNDTRY